MTKNRIINLWEHKGWGDSIYWLDYDRRSLTGHLRPTPIEGDEIRSKMESGKIGRFILKEVKRCVNPSDQFFATTSKLIGYLNEKD